MPDKKFTYRNLENTISAITGVIGGLVLTDLVFESNPNYSPTIHDITYALLAFLPASFYSFISGKGVSRLIFRKEAKRYDENQEKLQKAFEGAIHRGILQHVTVGYERGVFSSEIKEVEGESYKGYLFPVHIIIRDDGTPLQVDSEKSYYGIEPINLNLLERKPLVYFRVEDRHSYSRENQITIGKIEESTVKIETKSKI